MPRSLAFLGVVLLILSTDAFAPSASLGSARTPEAEAAKRTADEGVQRKIVAAQVAENATAKKAGQAADYKRQIDDARELNKRAIELYEAGRYSEAIPLVQRALAITEKALGPDHPDVAQSLNNLAVLYQAQGRYVEAEPLLKRSLEINEKAFGANSLDVARSLSNLAGLYEDQGRCGCGAAGKSVFDDTGKATWS
jgi:tetratricopeptide (TPR) repeat protein